ncbi:YdiU family protein [Siminovitchia sediminis]|uniref:Protein nucleotidyltransferase YdiU n=1 Tax=Siminovitchia sediminis TaxID=1274353 RepID=A0ABW4KH75_9BACI
MKKEAGWNFDNSYARLPKMFYSNVKPTPVKEPEMVIFNEELARSLGLNAKMLKHEGAAVFAGNEVPEDADPIAQAYAGHQFGHFTMLGDGRAVLLGEHVTPNGKRFDIQLKGSGRTPYSRGGDGRAALGPMLRECIISEAMHALGIPTTRSLSVVTTGEPVIREGRLEGAVLTRVAASHLRVGTFEYVVRWGGVENLQILADYAIHRHYPEIKGDENKYLSLLQKVIDRQAELIAQWQLVGFIHGVMNTDNMTISGETIDYGPCAFMDTYDPKTVFSSIDHQGRYAYENQPLIGGWNLARFAETLLPLLHEDKEEAIALAQERVSGFNDIYQTRWLTGMRAKLGLFNKDEKDEQLIGDLLDLMKKHRADFTNTFLALTHREFENSALFQSAEFANWKERWENRLESQKVSEEESAKLMRRSNPAVIPRNHRVEEALEAAVEEGDLRLLERLMNVLANPYNHSSEQLDYAKVPETNIPYVTYCGT